MRRLRLVRRAVRAIALVYGAIAVFERVAPREWVRAYQRAVNPSYLRGAGILPGFGVIETTGRRTGLPRQVPVGGRLDGDTFWFVAGAGRESLYLLNIEADPRVRVRVRGRWRSGIAHIVADDDARRRALWVNPINGAFVVAANPTSGMLTVRIDLDPEGHTSAMPDDRAATRRELLPEEKAAGSADPQAQTEQILAESDERAVDRDAAPTSDVEHRTSDEATPPA